MIKSDSQINLDEMREALRSNDVRIALPITFTHGRGVQIYVKSRKVGPIILRSGDQTLADLLHMIGTMAEENES